MAVFVGIDEAGFGPILGPLVISSAAFSVPESLLKADLWQSLKKSVGSRRKHLAGRLLIADSKKVYNRSVGIRHLQRTVLASLKCLDKNPRTLNELLEVLCPDCLGRLESYPWHRGTADCRISADESDIAIGAGVFAKDMAQCGMRVLKVESRCLDVAYYNRLMAAVKNKSNVLFSATSQLIKRAWDNLADDELQIIVDRQGGRVHYRKNLQLMFGEMELKVLKETGTNSSYEMRTGDKRMRLHFVVKADERFLPVALASMISKYVRELLVANINRYFRGFHAELKPTAGYWKDGLRFIDDLKRNVPQVDYQSSQLVRCR